MKNSLLACLIAIGLASAPAWAHDEEPADGASVTFHVAHDGSVEGIYHCQDHNREGLPSACHHKRGKEKHHGKHEHELTPLEVTFVDGKQAGGRLHVEFECAEADPDCQGALRHFAGAKK